MLWNGQAWYNTDTHLCEPMTPGDQETRARKNFRIHQSQDYLAGIASGAMNGNVSDRAYPPIAKQMLDSLPWRSAYPPHYDPRRDGDSSTHYSPYGAPPDGLAPVATALILLGIVGLVGGAAHGSSSDPYQVQGLKTCVKDEETFISDPDGGHVIVNTVQKFGAACP